MIRSQISVLPHVKTFVRQLFKTFFQILFCVLNDNTTPFISFSNNDVGVVSKLFKGLKFLFVSVFVAGSFDGLLCNFMSNRFLENIKCALVVHQGIKSAFFNEFFVMKREGSLHHLMMSQKQYFVYYDQPKKVLI